MLWRVYVCVSVCVSVRGQLAGIGFLLPLCGSQGSNTGCQSWQQAPLLLIHPDGPFIGLSKSDLYIWCIPTCNLQSDTNGEVKSPNHTLVISEFSLQSDRKFMSSDLSSFNRKIKVFCPPFFLGKTCQKYRYFWLRNIFEFYFIPKHYMYVNVSPTSLELEVWMIESHNMGARNWTWVLCKCNKCS